MWKLVFVHNYNHSSGIKLHLFHHTEMALSAELFDIAMQGLWRITKINLKKSISFSFGKISFISFSWGHIHSQGIFNGVTNVGLHLVYHNNCFPTCIRHWGWSELYRFGCMEKKLLFLNSCIILKIPNWCQRGRLILIFSQA